MRRPSDSVLSDIRETTLRCLLVLPLAAAAGCGSALFLAGMKLVTDTRDAHGWLLWTLPLLGLATVALYRLCKRSGAGNNLILDEIHEPGGGVPLRMAPLILITTCLAHLGGASVGREGTAVQMGGGIAGGWAKLLRLGGERTRMTLVAGVAAGFAGVFGTPLAATLFAMEVPVAGVVAYEFALPCLVAAYASDAAARLLGAHHERITLALPPSITAPDAAPLLMVKCLAAGVVFGLAAVLFVKSNHKAGAIFAKLLPNPWLRVVAGSAILIALVELSGTRAYLGIGTGPVPGEPAAPYMAAAFAAGGVASYVWLAKLGFTAISLGCGFRGGEVTPMFLTGAYLGNVIAPPLGLPPAFGAALGFTALFSAAAGVPLAGTLLGVELFGSDLTPFFAATCFVACKFGRLTPLYSSQRLHIRKA